jgi:hypothetical protein
MTGDTLALHTDTVLKTRNDERVPTRVIVVTIGRSHPPETAPEARSVVATPGITDGILAGGDSATLGTGPLKLALGRATLAPRSELSLHQTSGIELVAIASGNLSLVLPQGSAWLNPLVHSAVTAHEFEDVPAGQGVTVASGATVAYRNDGSSPLVALIVTVEPAA